MTKKAVIVWFRNDLRIKDNPALTHAALSGAPIIPLYILDESKAYHLGSASKWWLHHSIRALNSSLKKAGAYLHIRRGDSASILQSLIAETDADEVYWNRRYVQEYIEEDTDIKATLQQAGIEVTTFNGSLLKEPWELKTGSGTPYRVFTPFWKALRRTGPRRVPLPAPKKINAATPPPCELLSNWSLTPTNPDWAKHFHEEWKPGEKTALFLLERFLKKPVETYDEDRNRPNLEGTSRLSPHLAFGEISPVQIWQFVQDKIALSQINASQADKFLSELAWRDFSYSLLYYNPTLPSEPLKPQFFNYPWTDDQEGFDKWKKGATGYPIVDAGMRQLWKTGWMHNRVRMIVASFLIKDLLIPWKLGAEWFWDTLVDADIANNSASWQWVAGSGADASPYFRIFNPVTQSQKFDPNGDYLRMYLPELKNMPAKYIHEPWKASEEVLTKAGVILGKTYPKPILDHAEARRRALEGYKHMNAISAVNA